MANKKRRQGRTNDLRRKTCPTASPVFEREATSPILRLEEGETRTIVFGNPVNNLGKYRETVPSSAPRVNRPCNPGLSLAAPPLAQIAMCRQWTRPLRSSERAQ